MRSKAIQALLVLTKPDFLPTPALQSRSHLLFIQLLRHSEEKRKGPLRFHDDSAPVFFEQFSKS
eukprot:2404216-Amphidinium_carterae.1